MLSFIGIMCHVGIDVGTNTTAPKILMERFGWTLNEAAFATSLYFIFRTIGCFTGTVFLRFVMDSENADDYLEWCRSHGTDPSDESAEFYVEQTDIEQMSIV